MLLGGRLPRAIDALDRDGLIRARGAGSGWPARRGSDARRARDFRGSRTPGCRTWREATRVSARPRATPRSAATDGTTPSPARSGWARSSRAQSRRSSGFPIDDRRDRRRPSARWSNQFRARPRAPPQFTRGYGLTFGARRAQGDGDGAGRPRAARRGARRGAEPRRAQDEEFVLYAQRQRRGVGLRPASEASRTTSTSSPSWCSIRTLRGARGPAAQRTPVRRPYNFAYLDEQTKRMIRRAHPEGGRDPRLPGAVRQPRDAAALRLGHRRRPGDGEPSSARTTC